MTGNKSVVMDDAKKWIAGIDEAGRGSVMGPLVVVGVLADSETENMLKKMGVKDSKLLSASKRERLAGMIEKTAKDIAVMKIGPCKIDNYRKTGVTLNQLEGMKMAEIVNYLGPSVVQVDCPDTNIWKFSQFLKNMCREKCEIVVEHKADARYPLVSAASIIAKVERDRDIEKLKEKHGEIGSGYPHDPLTIRWLKDWISHSNDFPEFVRSTWETIEGLKRSKFQSLLSKWFKI